MNLFRVRGIQVAVHFSFFLLLAVFAFDGWGDGGRWIGMLWSVAMLIAFFVCVTLHEFGHSFTAMRFGVGVRRILLMPIGGMAEFDQMPRRPAHELLITLAGPAVNFVIAALLWIAVRVPVGGLMQGEYAANATGLAQLLLVWNLAMGCFNLLPIFPMDGGRILRALLAARLPYVRATFIAATVGKVLAVIAAGVALYFFHAFLTVVLFAFIFIAGELEYRATKRREAEDAGWRTIMARLQYASAASEEPPLLTR